MILIVVVVILGLIAERRKREQDIVVKVTKLPTVSSNGLFEFSVSVSNASRHDSFIGTIKLQNNWEVDLSPRAYPSSIFIGDYSVAPGTCVTRTGWSAFTNGNQDRIFVWYDSTEGHGRRRS
jgi:hypothetical protein